LTTRKRVTRKKGVITLDMFLSSQRKDSSKPEEIKKDTGTPLKQKEQRKTSSARRADASAPMIMEKMMDEEGKQEAKIEEKKRVANKSKSPLDILDELLSGFVKPEKKEKQHTRSSSHEEKKRVKTTMPASADTRSEGKEVSRRTEKSGKPEEESDEQVITVSNIIPTGKILDEILNKGLTDEFLKCDNTGKCTDGKRLGEIYTDKYGFKRQRGFVRTTRTPVYVDWIVEEATISKLLPKAYKLVTSRGAVAIIPEDFLCELQERYGVIIKSDEINCRSTKL